MEKTLNLANTKTERNYGIDLLRIVSMIMIITLHVLRQGGILSTTSKNIVKFGTVWFLEIMCLCSVNCYGLVSGYVGYGKKFKFSNIINLWFEVVFYNVIIDLLFFLLYKLKITNEFSGDFYTMLFPLTNRHYWYFTAYFFMSFFIPLFNFIVQILSKKKIIYLLLGIILINCVFYPYFFRGSINVFSLNQGYSIAWLSILYLVGAYIKKYDFLENIKTYPCILIFLFNSLLLLVCKFLEENGILIQKIHYAIMDYNNLLHLVNSVLLLLLFSKFRLNKVETNLIKFFAPATFGVFIIHTHLAILKLLYNSIYHYVQYANGLMLGAIVLTVLGIWLVCSLIDIVRIKIFEIFKVKKYCTKLEVLGRKTFDKLYDKYFAENVE